MGESALGVSLIFFNLEKSQRCYWTYTVTVLAELTGIEVTYKTSTKEYIYFSSVILISQEVFVSEKKGEEERQKHTRKRERERSHFFWISKRRLRRLFWSWLDDLILNWAKRGWGADVLLGSLLISKLPARAAAKSSIVCWPQRQPCNLKM